MKWKKKLLSTYSSVTKSYSNLYYKILIVQREYTWHIKSQIKFPHNLLKANFSISFLFIFAEILRRQFQSFLFFNHEPRNLEIVADRIIRLVDLRSSRERLLMGFVAQISIHPMHARWIRTSCSIYSLQSSPRASRRAAEKTQTSVYCASGSPAASSVTERPALITFVFHSVQTRSWIRDSSVGVCETDARSERRSSVFAFLLFRRIVYVIFNPLPEHLEMLRER